MTLRPSCAPRRLAAAFTLSASLALGVGAQTPGAEVPASHPARAILAHPVYTSESMVVGTWHTIAVGSGARTISGEPVLYDVQVSESEVTLASKGDAYGPRSFGIVRARRVESWVEYELRGQGGTYFLTAQVGKQADATSDAVFVLSPPNTAAAPERFAVAVAQRPTIPVDSSVAAAPPSIAKATPGARPRRVASTAPSGVAPRRVEAAALAAAATRRITPKYPTLARASNIEGTVVVEVTVDEGGKVTAARAIAGPVQLRSEAEHAAAEWRFTPFVDGDAPYPVVGSIAFKFTR